MKLGMDVMSWYYHVVVKNWPNRNRFWYKLLQTEASLKKARGSERERATFECETIYAAPPLALEFLNKGNIELH